MQEALNLARLAQQKGEVPVGAVLIDDANQRIASGYNQVIQNHDPSAHAEVVALREAGIQIKNYRLRNTTLYVTLEPCCMCAGALLHARVKRLVFGARDLNVGAAGSVFNFMNHPAFNHQIQVDEAILQPECSQLLNEFFASKR